MHSYPYGYAPCYPGFRCEMLLASTERKPFMKSTFYNVAASPFGDVQRPGTVTALRDHLDDVYGPGQYYAACLRILKNRLDLGVGAYRATFIVDTHYNLFAVRRCDADMPLPERLAVYRAVAEDVAKYDAWLRTCSYGFHVKARGATALVAFEAGFASHAKAATAARKWRPAPHQNIDNN